LLEHPGSFKPLIEGILLNLGLYKKLRRAVELEAAGQLPERILPYGASMSEEVVTNWLSLRPISYVMDAENPQRPRHSNEDAKVDKSSF
jgi:hypothetical protein